MKRSGIMLTMAMVLFIAVLALTIRPSLASRGTAQDEIQPEVAAPTEIMAVTAPIFSYQGQLSDADGNPISNNSLPMTFQLFATPTGGTSCWSENQNVNVESGQFNVLLGQTVAVPASCVVGDAYLELVVNSETMTPREKLTSVASAVKADTLSADAVTEGPLTVQGPMQIGGSILALPGVANLSLSNVEGQSVRLTSGDSVYMFLDANDNSSGSAIFGIYRNSDHFDGNAVGVMSINENGAVGLTGPLTVSSGGGLDEIRIGGSSGSHTALRYDGSRTLHLLPFVGPTRPYDKVCVACGTGGVQFSVAGSMVVNDDVLFGEDLTVKGDLNVVGTCTAAADGFLQTADHQLDETCTSGGIVSGAYIEANLMTPEELAAKEIKRFEHGDLLCWSAEGEQLELCSQANDRLVMAVASADGQPVVLGAEPVKVIGPVAAGDLLVASDVAGYAMVNNDPLPGTVIGQALQDLEGERGVIKAMIRKW